MQGAQDAVPFVESLAMLGQGLCIEANGTPPPGRPCTALNPLGDRVSGSFQGMIPGPVGHDVMFELYRLVVNSYGGTFTQFAQQLQMIAWYILQVYRSAEPLAFFFAKRSEKVRSGKSLGIGPSPVFPNPVNHLRFANPGSSRREWSDCVSFQDLIQRRKIRQQRLQFLPHK